MIGKVSGQYSVAFSGYPADDTEGPSDSAMKDRIRFGFVQLVGRIDPKADKGIDDPQPTAAIQPTVPDSAAKTPEKKSNKRTPPAHVYEYTWSVAAQGDRADWFEQLDYNDSMVVQIIYRTTGSRFHVTEVAASVKQVPPYCKTKAQDILDWVEMLAPFVDVAGKAMQAGGLTGPGKVVSSISALKVNSIPVSKTFPWYVKTFSAGIDPGIEWHLPVNLINLTGNRLTGSISLSFTDSGAIEARPPLNSFMDIEIRAFVRDGNGNEIFLSATNKPLLLRLTPV